MTLTPYQPVLQVYQSPNATIQPGVFRLAFVETLLLCSVPVYGPVDALDDILQRPLRVIRLLHNIRIMCKVRNKPFGHGSPLRAGKGTKNGAPVDRLCGYLSICLLLRSKPHYSTYFMYVGVRLS